MLAKSTILQHPLAKPISTPLLVPSFSSKGFGLDPSGRPEVRKLIEYAAEHLTEAMLISAYDLYYGNIDPLQHAITELTFVDSGGYETSNFQDLSAIFAHPVRRKPWTQERLQKVYDEWPEHIPAIFVSFDSPTRRGTVAQQAKRAHTLLKRYPNQLWAFLVKPEKPSDKLIPVDQVIANIPYFTRFQILGLTEKELGGSLIQRMENCAKIRLALNDAHLSIPIHIFGSLDPISVCLYFLSGAEIFDGLTWLRFGYGEGAALYRQNSAARSLGIQHTDDQVKLLTMEHNLLYLSDLSMQMRRFLNDYDFSQLQPNQDVLKKAFELLRSKNARVA
jgi:hypothetical protein